MMLVRLLSQMDTGAKVVPVGQTIELPDNEAQYLVSMQAAELVVEEVIEAKPVRRKKQDAE